MHISNESENNQLILLKGRHFEIEICQPKLRIWGEENPLVICKKRLHLQRVTVWWVFWSDGVFELVVGEAVTVNGVG